MIIYMPFSTVVPCLMICNDDILLDVVLHIVFTTWCIGCLMSIASTNFHRFTTVKGFWFTYIPWAEMTLGFARSLSPSSISSLTFPISFISLHFVLASELFKVDLICYCFPSLWIYHLLCWLLSPLCVLGSCVVMNPQYMILLDRSLWSTVNIQEELQVENPSAGGS